MHGRLRAALCASCGERTDWDAPMIDRPPCPACGERALRPDVVWFGEMPYHMEAIYAALAEADLFVSIGTSAARSIPRRGSCRRRQRRARGRWS